MCTWSRRTHKPRRLRLPVTCLCANRFAAASQYLHYAISYFLEHRSTSVWTLKYAMVVFTFCSSRISMVSRKHHNIPSVPPARVHFRVPEQCTSQCFYYYYFSPRAEQNTVGRLPHGHLGQCCIAQYSSPRKYCFSVVI